MKPIEELKDHSLINKKEFINASDINIRPIVKKILDKTKYVNHLEFIENLYKSIKKLL